MRRRSTFLRRVSITNEQTLLQIKKPLDDLESNLKYIPNGPFFNDLVPTETEIKDNILNLSCPCDSNAFVVASVCHEWKGVLEKRFKNKKVIIGEYCSVMQEDMLKAAADHKLDVHLVIYKQEVSKVDTKLVTDALTSVSKFTVLNDYFFYGVPILSVNQFEHLFESVEKGDKVFEEVKLYKLDLQDLSQERLASFLVNKIERLALYDVNFDFEIFITKLQEDSSTLKLTHLTIRDKESCPNFEHLISPEDLKTIFNKMTTLNLEGHFTLEQLEAIRSLTDVEVKPLEFEYFHSVKKSSSGMS